MTDAIRAATGVTLRIEGPCPGGQVGAAYVAWPDGHRAVLKWQPRTRLSDLPAGYPAPAAELAVQAGDAVAVVWELLPGAQTGHLTPALLDQALALNSLQAGQLAAHPAIPPVRLYLTSDGPGYCLHQPLRGHTSYLGAAGR
jgi:hypothetical protein